MNKLLAIILLAGCLATAGCTVDGAWVSSQPGAVVYTRTAAPGAEYVWIDGDWMWSGDSYAWHEGHWDRPRTGHVWVGGQWQNGSRGYRWHRGRWR